MWGEPASQQGAGKMLCFSLLPAGLASKPLSSPSVQLLKPTRRVWLVGSSWPRRGSVPLESSRFPECICRDGEGQCNSLEAPSGEGWGVDGREQSPLLLGRQLFAHGVGGREAGGGGFVLARRLVRVTHHSTRSK